MKRFAAFSLIGFLAWSALPVLPAGANDVVDVTIDCGGVGFGWVDFPDRPVDLHVLVGLDGDPVLEATVSTEGARAGAADVPVDFTTGTAEVSITWTLRDEHSAGPVTAQLDCDTTTTEPSTTTTQPEATTVPTTGTSTTPTTTSNDDCPDGGLACTSTSTTVPLIAGGVLALSAGTALILGPRLRRNRRALPRP